MGLFHYLMCGIHLGSPMERSGQTQWDLMLA